MEGNCLRNNPVIVHALYCYILIGVLFIGHIIVLAIGSKSHFAVVAKSRSALGFLSHAQY